MPVQDQLAEFAAWVKQHLTGDEKGEAQIYLDHLFQALGWTGGLREAGAPLEMRVPKTDQGGTAFADLVLKSIVLVEMNTQGEDLREPRGQFLDRGTRLVRSHPPDRTLATVCS